MVEVPIRIVVHGARGKMGQTILQSLCREPGMRLVGAVDIRADSKEIPVGEAGSIPLASRLNTLLEEVTSDVIIDFSTASATVEATRIAAPRGINLVIGTTGLGSEDLAEIEKLVNQGGIGAVIAPNFSLGAVLMMHLAKQAALYFNQAEIIEMHHAGKRDAPSGTALSTAKAMLTHKGKEFDTSPEAQGDPPSRGDLVGGIRIHSVRLPGIMAQQEVILGGEGETLAIKHEAINRNCYLPGIILAVKEVTRRKGLIWGLEEMLGLK